MDRLGHFGGRGVGRLVRGVPAARHDGDHDRNARGRGGLVDPDIPTQNDLVIDAGPGARRDQLQHRKHAGQLVQFVPLPVLLGGKADTAPVRAAAQD